MVFYRKYRPQTLDELIGQEMVKQTLKSALAADKLSHAYLFCGPRGTGKTSTARILAKIVNCEKNKLSVLGSQLSDRGQSVIGQSETDKQKTEKLNSENRKLRTDNQIPCNSCPTCLSITEGSNLDVIEMDAASNRGIDDIRSLKENIKLSPSSAKKKVYIIDEVHMLSGEAFNALLKTLEEPPAHVLFILATTEVQKIPQTILSRVSKLDFKLATLEELVEAIKKVAGAEKMKIEEDALILVAKHAQGSFRDGVKILDILSGFDNIDESRVKEILKNGVFEDTYLLLENISQRNAAECLKNLAKQMESGVNIKELNLTILDTLRNLLLIKHGLGQQLVKPGAGEKYKSLESLGAGFSLEHLIQTISSFQNALEQGRYISIPILPLELAVVESCGDEKLGKGKEASMENGSKVKSGKALEREEKEVESTDSQFLNPNWPPSPNLTPQTSSNDLSKISEKWTYILETVRAYNFSLEALLRSSKITQCSEHNIIVEVPYSFHQRILEAPKSRDLLESIFADILGRSIKVSTALGQRPVRKEEIANVELAADDEIVRIASEIFNSEPN